MSHATHTHTHTHKQIRFDDPATILQTRNENGTSIVQNVLVAGSKLMVPSLLKLAFSDFLANLPQISGSETAAPCPKQGVRGVSQLS